MNCTHPLKGFYTFQQNTKFKDDYNHIKYRGDKKIKVTSSKVDHLELIQGKIVKCYDSKISQFAERVFSEYIDIPCGKCIACRLRRSREWANRCMLELQYHDSSYFVTLTYNDDNLPFVTYIDEDGYYKYHSTLVKKDLQDFMKRLRKNYKYDNHLKYYACGEYGDNTHRSHYHIIIFGLRLDDLQYYKKSDLGFNYYTSEFLNKVWKKGFVVVTDVSWETCAYTARYIMKKQLGKDSWIYDDLGIEPEFTTMSLKPAIGYQYFLDHKDEIYDLDKIYIKTESGGKQFKPPKYFDEKMKFSEEDFATLDDCRTVRQALAEARTKQRLMQTDLDEAAYRELEEDLLMTRLKALPRKEI